MTGILHDLWTAANMPLVQQEQFIAYQGGLSTKITG